MARKTLFGRAISHRGDVPAPMTLKDLYAFLTQLNIDPKMSGELWAGGDVFG